MQLRKELSQYGNFETLEEYNDYIIESRINGQHKQAKQLYNNLTREEQTQFWDYIETAYHYEIDTPQEMADTLQELGKYFEN